MNPYEILGVAYEATKAEIKKAYRAKAKIMHPDVCSDKVTAERQFKELNQAYELLLSGKFKFSTQTKTAESRPHRAKPTSNAVRVFAYKEQRDYYDTKAKMWFRYHEWFADLWISPALAQRGGKLPVMVKRFNGLPPFTFILLIPEQEFFYDKTALNAKYSRMTVNFTNIKEPLVLLVRVMDL